jgi:hypothetical protein
VCAGDTRARQARPHRRSHLQVDRAVDLRSPQHQGVHLRGATHVSASRRLRWRCRCLAGRQRTCATRCLCVCVLCGPAAVVVLTHTDIASHSRRHQRTPARRPGSRQITILEVCREDSTTRCVHDGPGACAVCLAHYQRDAQ